MDEASEGRVGRKGLELVIRHFPEVENFENESEFRFQRVRNSRKLNYGEGISKQLYCTHNVESSYFSLYKEGWKNSTSLVIKSFMTTFLETDNYEKCFQQRKHTKSQRLAPRAVSVHPYFGCQIDQTQTR